LIKLSGGYIEEQGTNGLMNINSYSGENKSWNIGVTVGYALNQNWEMGVGFSYTGQRLQSSGTDFFMEETGSLFAEEAKLSVYRPTGIVYAGYNAKIFKRLYFSSFFYANIGRNNGDWEALNISISDIPVDNPIGSLGYVSSVHLENRDISTSYLGLQVSPELTLYLSDKFGINLRLGGVGVDVNDGDWDEKQVFANFNPKYWQLGFVLGF
jgi:hypothetical protein